MIRVEEGFSFKKMKKRRFFRFAPADGRNATAPHFDMAGTKEVKQRALDDPDLEPLWAAIGEI
jgi:hypothetical protein